jgi:hypothetical protein
VTWHVESYSTGPEFQDTTLIVEMSDGVELVSGDVDWKGTVPAGGVVPLELVIRVTTPGEWRMTAGAGSIIGPGSSAGGWKTLYIISSEISAEVIEDIHWVGTSIPSLQIPPTNTPEAAPASNP